MLESVLKSIKSFREPSAGIQTQVGVLKYLDSTTSAKQSELSSKFPKLTIDDLNLMESAGFIERVKDSQEDIYRICELGLSIYNMHWLPK